jgi:hypothetical protein
MQIKQKIQGACQASKCDRHHLHALIRLLCTVLFATPSWAASVYRCGNDYSTSALCAQGDAVVITPNAEPQTSGPRKASISSTDAHEADALEKRRLNAENRATRQNATRVIVTAPSKPADIDSVPRTEPHSASRRRPLKSPYFTAKDPNGPPKKKGNAMPLPPDTK